MKTAVVIGASGLVGSHLTAQLIDSPFYSKIILLNRRASNLSHSKIEEKIIDFENPDLSGIKSDDVFCAIGTTIKKAGSQAAQFKIDCDYPLRIASILRSQGATQFILVSSIGAKPNSSNFYLRTKGQLEKNINALNFSSAIFIRPSFILGDRKEFRFGEKMAIVLMTLLKPLFNGPLIKYRGVKASAIASKMISCANQNLKGEYIIPSDLI